MIGPTANQGLAAAEQGGHRQTASTVQNAMHKHAPSTRELHCWLHMHGLLEDMPM